MTVGSEVKRYLKGVGSEVSTTQPDISRTARAVYFAHHVDLLSLLLFIVLVDTNGVGPECN
jgi:hypothetical protein